MTYDQAAVILDYLKQIKNGWINGKNINNDMLTIYAAQLAENQIPMPVIEIVMTMLLSKTVFWPSFADIMRECENVIRKSNNTRVKEADEAWAEVYSAAKYGKSGEWSNPEIGWALEYVGGMSAIIYAPASNAGIIRAQYRDAYNNVCRRNREDNVIKSVIQRLPASVRSQLMNVQQNMESRYIALCQNEGE